MTHIDPPALDPRQNAFRTDLADIRLKGIVNAPSYAEGKPSRIGLAAAPLMRSASLASAMDSQLLPGEAVEVFEQSNGWAWVQSARDGYVGYIPCDRLADRNTEPSHAEPTHWVSVASTVVLPDAKQEAAPIATLSLGSRVQVSHPGERFHQIAGGGYIFAQHLCGIETHARDWVHVARRLLGLPYLWGGRGAGGIDCSGLVQLALEVCGIPAMRDSDQQASTLGEPVSLDPSLWRAGDCLYTRGHVVILTGSGTVLHATGYKWSVIEEPLDHCLRRLRAQARPVISVRRPLPTPLFD